MKSVLYSLIAIIAILFSYSCSGSGSNAEQNSNKQDSGVNSGIVEVYYFHFEQRCVTCINVQNATLRVLEEDFKNDLDNGRVVFHEVNLSTPQSAATASKLGVGAQSLLVVNGDLKIDLTMQGFMIAGTDYERFKSILTEAIVKAKG